MKNKSEYFSSKCHPISINLADGRNVRSWRFIGSVNIRIPTENGESFEQPLPYISTLTGNEIPMLGLLGLETLDISISKTLEYLTFDKRTEESIGYSKPRHE